MKQDAQAIIEDIISILEKIDNGSVNYADIKEAVTDIKNKVEAMTSTLPDAPVQGE